MYQDAQPTVGGQKAFLLPLRFTGSDRIFCFLKTDVFFGYDATGVQLVV